MRWLALLVMALALVAAGCGGGDDDSSASDDTTIEETTTTEETTDESTESDTEDTDTSGSIGSGVSGDCLEAVAAFAALGQAVGGAGGGNSDDVLEAQQTFDDYIENAPDDIKSDLEVIAAAYATYIQAVSDLGLEPGETPSAEQLGQLAGAAQELGTPEVQEAAENWTQWATEECPSG